MKKSMNHGSSGSFMLLLLMIFMVGGIWFATEGIFWIKSKVKSVVSSKKTDIAEIYGMKNSLQLGMMRREFSDSMGWGNGGPRELDAPIRIDVYYVLDPVFSYSTQDGCFLFGCENERACFSDSKITVAAIRMNCAPKAPGSNYYFKNALLALGALKEHSGSLYGVVLEYSTKIEDSSSYKTFQTDLAKPFEYQDFLGYLYKGDQIVALLGIDRAEQLIWIQDVSEKSSFVSIPEPYPQDSTSKWHFESIFKMSDFLAMPMALREIKDFYEQAQKSVLNHWTPMIQKKLALQQKENEKFLRERAKRVKEESLPEELEVDEESGGVTYRRGVEESEFEDEGLSLYQKYRATKMIHRVLKSR